MIRAALILAFVGGVAVLSAAQVPSPAFEVASVKPSPPNPPTVSLGSLRGLPPGQWRALRVNPVQLIAAAYPEYAFEGLVVGGPAWVRKDQFDIDARMDPKTTPAETATMIARL